MINDFPEGYHRLSFEEFHLDSSDHRWPERVTFIVHKILDEHQQKERWFLEVFYNYHIHGDGHFSKTETIGFVENPKLAAWVWMHQRPNPPKPAERPRHGLLWHLVQAVKAWNEYGL